MDIKELRNTYAYMCDPSSYMESDIDKANKVINDIYDVLKKDETLIKYFKAPNRDSDVYDEFYPRVLAAFPTFNDVDDEMFALYNVLTSDMWFFQLWTTDLMHYMWNETREEVLKGKKK